MSYHKVQYTLYITDNGVPAEGLSPKTVDFFGVESGTDLAELGHEISFTSLGKGHYKAEVDWSCFQNSVKTNDCTFVLRIDAGDSIKNPMERYVTLRADKPDMHSGYAIDMLTSMSLKVNRILDLEQGQWAIKDNKLRMYDNEGTLLTIFHLFDEHGVPTNDGPYRREPQFIREVG